MLERKNMKKLIALLLFSGLALTACSSNKTDANSSSSSKEKTEQTATSSSSEKDQKKIEEEQKKLEQLRKDFNDAMTNENAVFPQLSNEVAEDEAEVKITTTEGDITVKLFPKYAPLAVENFLTHAKEGYYNGLLFHRVINNFMIQTGDPKGDGTGGESIWKGKDKSKDSGTGFENEYSPYLYNLRGALAMANSGPNTNGSQFYIKIRMIFQVNSQLTASQLRSSMLIKMVEIQPLMVATTLSLDKSSMAWMSSIKLHLPKPMIRTNQKQTSRLKKSRS